MNMKIVQSLEWRVKSGVNISKVLRGFTSTSEEHRAFTSQSEKDGNALRVHDLRTMAKQTRPGFTLIEMMVAVSIFAIVMMIGVGALLALIDTNKRAQAINSVMNNVNAAVESMSRSIRVGTTYHCHTGAATPFPSTLSTTQDCTDGGGVLFAFEKPSGDRDDDGDQVVYRINGTQIERNLFSGVADKWVAMTAPEVSIDSLEFYVLGSDSSDSIQPRVVMVIQGSANVPGGVTNFSVQSSVTQRLIDI